MKQVVSVLIYLKNNHIEHLDMKLENFLLKTKGDISEIKLIDFGFPYDLSYENITKDLEKSPFFNAPEVFDRRGTSKSDIWSAGVIMYIMLSGKLPFPGKTSTQIVQNVLTKELAFNYPEFKKVSLEAKQLIS